MYLIDESVEVLQKFLDKEWNFEEIATILSGTYYNEIVDSTWKDYADDISFQSGVRQYGIEDPMNMIEILQKLWGDYPVLKEEEFIKNFVVSAFRQTITTMNADEKVEYQSVHSVPTYIYNF